jgi:hypothetical protein
MVWTTSWVDTSRLMPSSRPAPRERRDGVHVVLGHAHDCSEVTERLGRKVEIDLASMLATAKARNSLVHERRCVRHRANHPAADRQMRLDRCGADARRHREQRLLGRHGG